MIWLRSLFVLILISAQAWATKNAESSLNYNDVISGKWQYVGHYYQGQFQQPYNPNLILTFEFSADGISRLHWSRTNEAGFCDRIGHFAYDGEQLTDQVMWVNPENTFECAKDPDMRVGNKTITRVKIIEGKLYMELPVGDETLTYVWESR